MRHSDTPPSPTSRSYAPSNYDHELCLKPPLLLWAAVLYLNRAILLPVAVGLGHVAGVNADAMTVLRGFWNEETLIPSLAAAPVLYALLRRVPAASAAVRWIWARGRGFLAASATLDLVPLALWMWHRDTEDTWLPLFAAGVDAYFLLYLLAARRVRDTFAEFPASLDPASK